MKRRIKMVVWAAVAMTAATASAQTYRIDINDADDSVTSSGWSGLDAAHTSNGGGVTVGGVTFECTSCDGARLRRSAGNPNPDALFGDFVYDDGNGVHQLLAQSFSPPQPQLMRLRCVIDIAESTGSVSYYDGTDWLAPAAFQNQEMYIGSGRDEHDPEKWNKIAFTGNTTSGSLWDNIAVVYEPPRGTLFTVR